MRPDFEIANFVAPTIVAVVFILIMSTAKEPTRQNFNAVASAGFATLYANGGFGMWEVAYMAVAFFPAYLGLRSYSWIGVVWLMHAGWDLAHHLYGNTLFHWAPSSSFGCLVMDAIVSVWFFLGAPSIFDRYRAQESL